MARLLVCAGRGATTDARRGEQSIKLDEALGMTRAGMGTFGLKGAGEYNLAVFGLPAAIPFAEPGCSTVGQYIPF